MASSRKITGYLNNVSGVSWGNISGNISDQSDLNKSLESIKFDISSEAENRQKADKSLSSSIIAEEDARIAADKVLENKITTKEWATDTFYTKLQVDGKIGMIHIPSKISELDNDSGYLTEHQDISYLATKDEMSRADEEIKASIPTKVSQLKNDEGYLTEHQDISHLATKTELLNVKYSIPSKVSELQNDSGYLTEHQSLSAYRTSEDQDIIDNAKVDKNGTDSLMTEEEHSKLAELHNYDDTELRDTKQDKLIPGRNITIDGTTISTVGDVNLVEDVKVNGSSVVNDKIADISVPIKNSQLENDSNFTTNLGTVTSVGVKVNNSIAGTVTESGVIDLGKLAPLGDDNKVPSANLPSYVDDVEEYESRDDFPEVGESGKIYVDTSTNLTYRWSGTTYIEISPSLALGETASTAYPGDKGKSTTDLLSSHTSNNNIHITSSERANWNSKTSNTGTVESITVKMNGSNKGTITTTGTIDLGTVITEHQSLANYRTASEQSAIDNTKVNKNGTDSLMSANEHTKLASLQNYDDTEIKESIETKQDKLIAGANIKIAEDGKTISAASDTNLIDDVQVNGESVVTEKIAKVTVPTKNSELENDSKFTSNTGTVTSISVKMNGSNVGTITESGTIDLGTVITDISGKQDTLTAGKGITITSSVISTNVNGQSATITGDGTTTQFTITHSLNTRDVAIQLYDLSDYATVIADTLRPTTNSVVLKFKVAPSSGKSYKVILISL